MGFCSLPKVAQVSYRVSIAGERSNVPKNGNVSPNPPQLELYPRAGRPEIADEFQHTRLTSQQKYRLRRRRDGLCVLCGGPRPCRRHNERARAERRAAKRAALLLEWKKR